MAQSTETRRGPEPPDLSEKGGIRNGQPQRSDQRLFMQLLAFGGCHDSRALADALARAGVTGVLYEDVNDPRGIALLTFDADPAFFVDQVRPRHPPRLPRSRQRRQRFHRRADWEGVVPALRRRASDAQDAADRVVPRAARAVLRRASDLADPPVRPALLRVGCRRKRRRTSM